MIFINSPMPEDFAIAKEYNFDVYTTDERGGNIMAGPALAYLVGNSSADCEPRPTWRRSPHTLPPSRLAAHSAGVRVAFLRFCANRRITPLTSRAADILFMEKDFVLNSDKPTMMREFYTGFQHLARGVDVYR